MRAIGTSDLQRVVGYFTSGFYFRCKNHPKNPELRKNLETAHPSLQCSLSIAPPSGTEKKSRYKDKDVTKIGWRCTPKMQWYSDIWTSEFD